MTIVYDLFCICFAFVDIARYESVPAYLLGCVVFFLLICERVYDCRFFHWLVELYRRIAFALLCVNFFSVYVHHWIVELILNESDVPNLFPLRFFAPFFAYCYCVFNQPACLTRFFFVVVGHLLKLPWVLFYREWITSWSSRAVSWHLQAVIDLHNGMKENYILT